MAKRVVETRKVTSKQAKKLDSISVVRVKEAQWEIKLDVTPWTAGPSRFRNVPSWANSGLKRPPKNATWNTKKNPNFRDLQRQSPDPKAPFADLTIFPSVDPYPATLRALFRLLMEENPWIQRANIIIQKSVCTKAIREAEPRANKELQPEELEKWKNKKIPVPFFKEKKSPAEIESWMDQLASTLDLDVLIFDAYLFIREQGRSCIGLFPEKRDEETGKYVIPKALRLIRPELLRRPIINFDNGELAGVEVTGLSSAGSLLDANRALYMFKAKNLELFSDFYGRSDIRALADVGKVMQIIYARDYLQATLHSWHTPMVFKHTLPSKDYSNASTILDNFNEQLANNAGNDISVTANVEPISTQSNPGDITGLINIENQMIDAIAGSYNIPPFMLAKGKAGRLGGNANEEEIDAFLNLEIKPEQELLELMVENQFYDRILAILFDVEPEEARNPDKVPIRIRHKYEKPTINQNLNLEKFNILMFLVDNGKITMESAMDRLGLRSILANSPSEGTDTSPSIKTWKRSSQWDIPTNTKQTPTGGFKQNFNLSPSNIMQKQPQEKNIEDGPTKKIKSSFDKNTS